MKCTLILGVHGSINLRLDAARHSMVSTMHYVVHFPVQMNRKGDLLRKIACLRDESDAIRAESVQMEHGRWFH